MFGLYINTILRENCLPLSLELFGYFLKNDITVKSGI
jgi:hypothetical protein